MIVQRKNMSFDEQRGQLILTLQEIDRARKIIKQQISTASNFRAARDEVGDFSAWLRLQKMHLEANKFRRESVRKKLSRLNQMIKNRNRVMNGGEAI